MPAPIPSPEFAAPPQPLLEREQAPLAEPASSSEGIPPTPKPAPVASHVAAQAAMPVEKTAPSRPAIPKAHLRFAGPGFAPVLDDMATPALASMAAPDAAAAPERMPASAKLPAPVRPRAASRREHKRWVLTSIAPRLTSEHPEARDDRVPVFLCGLIAALFLALASLKGDGRDYAAALLFGLLTVTLLVLNHERSRHD